jgi:hypothetical protein
MHSIFFYGTISLLLDQTVTNVEICVATTDFIFSLARNCQGDSAVVSFKTNKNVFFDPFYDKLIFIPEQKCFESEQFLLKKVLKIDEIFLIKIW